MSIKELLEKGDGVLIKRNGVWTYPGCANDASGTNLVLPVDYLSDAEVQKALSAGELRAAITSPTGAVSAVRLIDDETAVITAGLAGSAEMGTELPQGSRVEHDAGRKVESPADVERQVAEGLKAALTPPASPQSKPAEPIKAKR